MISTDWATIEAFAIRENTSVQWVDKGDRYSVSVSNGLETYWTEIFKRTPRQADQISFEDTYKAVGNKPQGIKITGGDGLYKASVDSVGRFSVVTTTPDVMYRTDNLRLNGAPVGSKAMNVNDGAASFRFQPNLNSLTVPYYLEQLTIEIEDQGDFLGTNFGALAALTNGIAINIKSKGQTFRLALIQDNADLYGTFSEFPGSQSIAVLLQSNRNMYFGTMTLQNRIVLDPTQGDYVEAVINDNLTGLNTLTMRVSTWRTL